MAGQWFFQILMTACAVFLSWIPVSAGTDSPVSYRYEVELSEFKKGEMERYGISLVHPYAFELKTLQNSMWALAYQNRTISWSKKKHVFDRQAVKALGPLLVDHFWKVGGNQKVTFKILKASGKILFMGDVFMTPEGLNWRVTYFKGSGKPVDDFSVMGDSERLVPLKGQKYKTKEERPGLVQNITNWVIFPAIIPEKNRILPEIESTDSRNFPNPEETAQKIKRRLKVLENLKKEGVITDAEYRQKRKEILRGF